MKKLKPKNLIITAFVILGILFAVKIAEISISEGSSLGGALEIHPSDFR